MKKLHPVIVFNLILMVTLAACSGTNTQSRSTTTFGVTGVCKMCKDRIESALLVKGVYSAEWDQDEQEVTVVYKPSLISVDKMHQLVAKAGHDTDKVTAPDAAYDAIPGCCKYRDGVQPH